MGMMESAQHLKPAGEAASAPAKEYLTFRLGDEEYGIDILKVQEIRSYEAPTRIANAPAFVKGVVNLRGVIVPIVDLRLRFATARCDYNAFTVTVVLHVAGRVVGVVVDSVSDVLGIAPQDIRPAPEIGSAVNAASIVGLAALADRMLILLDIEKLMSAADMGLSD